MTADLRTKALEAARYLRNLEAWMKARDYDMEAPGDLSPEIVADLLEELAAAVPPEGWKLVPIEPTEAMKRAAFGPIMDGGRNGPLTSDYIRREGALAFWAGMVRAAPAPPSPQDDTRT
jgi:hypothetical protein